METKQILVSVPKEKNNTSVLMELNDAIFAPTKFAGSLINFTPKGMVFTFCGVEIKVPTYGINVSQRKRAFSVLMQMAAAIFKSYEPNEVVEDNENVVAFVESLKEKGYPIAYCSLASVHTGLKLNIDAMEILTKQQIAETKNLAPEFVAVINNGKKSIRVINADTKKKADEWWETTANRLLNYPSIK